MSTTKVKRVQRRIQGIIIERSRDLPRRFAYVERIEATLHLFLVGSVVHSLFEERIYFETVCLLYTLLLVPCSAAM